MTARLDLFLAYEGIQFQFQFGIGDIDHRELLSVVTGGGVAYGLENGRHVLGVDFFAFIPAYAASVEEGFFYTFHEDMDKGWCKRRDFSA